MDDVVGAGGLVGLGGLGETGGLVGWGQGVVFGFGEAQDGAAFQDAYGEHACVFAFFDVSYRVSYFYDAADIHEVHGFHVAEDHVGVGTADAAYIVGAEPEVGSIALFCGSGGYYFHHLLCVACGGAYLQAQAP